MKRNGFTLIELLAVIVVLAIIAVIATPIVLNTIDDAKKGAAKSGTYSYIEEVETEVSSYMIKNNGARYAAGKYNVEALKTDLGVEVKGDAPSEGNICIASNGTVSKASIKINGYVVSYDGKEATTTDEKEIEDITCDSVVGGPTQVLAQANETYKAIVYLDPTDLTKICDASNSSSETGVKKGCMKWYAYNDDGTNYTMILDHNTTPLVAYNSTGSNSEMKEVAVALTSDTSSWVSGLNPRLISADEVAQLTGATDKLQWYSNKPYERVPVIGTSVSWFYFDGAEKESTLWQEYDISVAPGVSKYAWLYDNTYGCTSYRCNAADDEKYKYGTAGGTEYIHGYWTSSPVVGLSNYAWYVHRNSSLSLDYIYYDNYFGVRPVITISKSIFS